MREAIRWRPNGGDDTSRKCQTVKVTKGARVRQGIISGHVRLPAAPWRSCRLARRAAGGWFPNRSRPFPGAGYFGLLVDRECGGQGVLFLGSVKFVTQMATTDATVAGLAPVMHGYFEAVDPTSDVWQPCAEAK